LLDSQLAAPLGSQPNGVRFASICLTGQLLISRVHSIGRCNTT
jgi:hypothetical protein